MTGKHTAANSVWPLIAVSKYNLGLRPAPLIPVIPSIPVLRAAQWLLDSGIQSETGGFSRYRQTDIARNMPVSTEITGYAVSGLCLLFEESGEEKFLLAARRAADFLCLSAWDPESSSMPFELNASGVPFQVTRPYNFIFLLQGIKAFDYDFSRCFLATRGSVALKLRVLQHNLTAILSVP